MRRAVVRVSAFLFVSFLVPTPVLCAQEPPPPRFATPHGYQRPTANRQFAFVMLAPPGTDLTKLPRSYQAQTEELAAKYPASGLYRTGETTPVWTYNGPYAYDVFPANDGIHLAVLEGESWFTSQFVSGQKLAADVEKAQLDSPAVTIYKGGTKLASHTIRDVVSDVARLRHSPQHVQWRAGEAIVERTGRFVLYTQDSQKVVFDLTTGALLSKEPAGQDAKYFLAAVAVVTVVTVLLGVRWLVRGPKPAVLPAGALAGPPPAP
jgi:hypothetical protein